MFCTGDATAIQCVMPALQGLQEKIRHRHQLTNGELERLRSISVILIQSNLSTPWKQKMAIVERVSIMGR